MRLTIPSAGSLFSCKVLGLDIKPALLLPFTSPSIENSTELSVEVSNTVVGNWDDGIRANSMSYHIGSLSSVDPILRTATPPVKGIRAMLFC